MNRLFRELESIKDKYADWESNGAGIAMDKAIEIVRRYVNDIMRENERLQKERDFFEGAHNKRRHRPRL